jgi:hypothetical protein
MAEARGGTPAPTFSWASEMKSLAFQMCLNV